jgi:hypothetical protein
VSEQRWPEGTQLLQYAYYQPLLDVGLGPAIHVQVYLTPGYQPAHVIWQLEHAVHELTHKLRNGHANGEEEGPRGGNSDRGN